MRMKGVTEMETYMQMLGRLAKNASRGAAKLGTKAKNRGLLVVANELVEERELILQENAKDIEAAKDKGVKQSLIDRLALTEQRIEDMAEGLREIAALDDPIGEVLGMKTRPNGLRSERNAYRLALSESSTNPAECDSRCIWPLLQDRKCGNSPRRK